MDADSVLGQTTKVFLVRGEPILASKLSTAGGGLSVRIPESMRATSVKVNEVTGVSGFILPGDRVDVLVTIDNLSGIGNAVTKTIVQNSEVLAAGIKTETKKDNPIKVQSVTLLVDPKQAEDLALAIHEGTIHLVLRNPIDHEIAEVSPVSTKEVMGGAEKPKPAPAPRRAPSPKKADVEPPPPPPAEATTYTMIRSGTVKEEKFPNEAPVNEPEQP
jgi:pilus assembly protein CpaB